MTGYRTVLLDAHGTLFALDQPHQRLADAIAGRLGTSPPPDEIRRALGLEMRHYAQHCHEAGDAQRLRRLRLDCAAIIARELGLEDAVASEALAAAIVYRVFPDVPGLLAELRRRAVPVAVVSNWDYALPELLARLGLIVDAVVTSAGVGAAKPDPAPFREALRRLDADPATTLHVGDRPEIDRAGALAAGIDAQIIDRTGGTGTIAALTEITPLLA